MDTIFRRAASQQVAQLGREIETLSTENSQLRAELNRFRTAASSATSSSASTFPSTLLDELLIAGDRTIPTTPTRAIPLNKSNPLCVEAHSSAQHLICIGSADKHVTLIDWIKSTDVLLHTVGRVETSSPILSVRFFPNHTHLVLASGMNGSCQVVDFRTNQIVLQWRDHDSYILDARTALRLPSTVDSRREAAGKQMEHPTTGNNTTNTHLQCVTVSRDHSCVVSALTKKITRDDENNATSWERTKLRSFYFENVIESAVFVSPTLMGCTETLIVAERNNNNLIYCDIGKNTKRLFNLNEKQDDHVSFNVLRLEVSPSGRHVLVATDTHRIFILGQDAILRNFYGHTSDEMSTPRIGWDPSEKYIVSNSQKDCTCHVWNIASERTELQLQGHGRAVRDLCVVGNQLFTVSYDQKLMVWSMGGDPSSGSGARKQQVKEQILQEQKLSSSSAVPLPLPAAVSSPTTVPTTMEECDLQLKLFNTDLNKLSNDIQTIKPSEKETKALLKKKSRQLRKQIKEWTRKKKEMNRHAQSELMKNKHASLLKDPCVTAMITDAQQGHVQVYANMKDANAASRRGKFIVEGKEPIRLLLDSNLWIHSLYLKPTIYNTLKPDIVARFERGQDKRFPIYISTSSVMANVAGYLTARGSFACGIRPMERNEEWLYQHVLKTPTSDCSSSASCSSTSSSTTTPISTAKSHTWNKNFRLLAVDGCNNTANLGSLVRSGTALGIDAILISQDCCDPWYRQCVRVSMGHIFRTPVIRVVNLAQTLMTLQTECGMRTWGAVIDKDVHRMKIMNATEVGHRWCGIVGNEDKGISTEVRNVCQRKGGKHGGLCRIDMASDVDSMSITVAAGIFLNGLCEREER